MATIKDSADRKPGRPFSNFEGASLSREQIISKALEIVSDKGLDGLTIQSLAKSLQVSRAPIYAIFASRQTLVEAVIDKVLSEINRTVTAEPQDWQGRLRQGALNTFQIYRKYPGVGPEMVRTGIPDTEVGRYHARSLSKLLRKAGVPKQLIPTFIFVYSSMIAGAEMEFTGQETRESEGSDRPEARKRLNNRRGDTLPLKQLNTETFADAVDIMLLGMDAFIARHGERSEN